MTDRAIIICPRCAAVQRENTALKVRVAELEGQLAKAGKDSSNSSKPPSSDIVKPPKGQHGRKGRKKRRRGGQPGHSRHERAPFPEEQIDHREDYSLDECPDCGGQLAPTDDPPRVVQQVELLAKLVEVTEHRSVPGWCAACRKAHYAPLPDGVRQAGLVGPALTAFFAYLKGACHCSFSTIRDFSRDVLSFPLSRGQLSKLCGKAADSLDAAYQEVLRALPDQTRINVDETGHKDNGQPMWTWCFRAVLFTLFRIAPSRGSEVLVEVLGMEFNGILGCDYFSAYRKYMKDFNVLVQFCLAHLIRDVKFLVEHPDSRNRAYGRRVLDKLRNLFAVIHRREKLSARSFAVELENAGDELWAEATWRVPNRPEAQNLARRFDDHGESYIRFITTPGIEPTNNLAEQAIRFVVLDRHVTQGSRSPAGQRWLERIWTTVATCTQQGRSVFLFLRDSIMAHLEGQPTPSLVLPDTS
jgi:transposase